METICERSIATPKELYVSVTTSRRVRMQIVEEIAAALRKEYDDLPENLYDRIAFESRASMDKRHVVCTGRIIVSVPEPEELLLDVTTTLGELTPEEVTDPVEGLTAVPGELVPEYSPEVVEWMEHLFEKTLQTD
jgi:hypothetical protein